MEGKVIEMKLKRDLWFGIRMLIYGLIIGSLSCHWWMYRYHAIDYGNGRAQGWKDQIPSKSLPTGLSSAACMYSPDMGRIDDLICFDGVAYRYVPYPAKPKGTK